MNTEGETVAGVRYTAIASRADSVVTPPQTALLAAPAGINRNIWLQDACPTDGADHGGMLADSRASAAVLGGLADDGRALPC
ncbi:hypothetical protein [Nocardia brasiliensis]|uniref:hypothetical protein n=1 Tax=Nocardia brasiliensis TaxID=37326 RepID=UPI002454FA14|nr:hypothetical protein [Nocardia brasiliensis]